MNWETEGADVLVVGGGAAGCRAAVEAAERGLRVILLCKEVFGKAQTLMASEGYAGAFARGDSWKGYFRDTLNAGGWINNQTLVEVLTKESSNRLLELEEHGTLLDRLPNGDLALRSFSSHITPRVCTAHDEIGHIIMTTLVEDIRRLQVRVVEEFYATQLMLKNGVAVGVSGIHIPTGNYVVYLAKATILATGGAGRLFEVTSNSRNSTGDGYALALKAGAHLVDMEMMLFHPTAFVYPESQRGIVISEAVRVIGGVLHNKNKERFMEKHNSEFKDLAPSSETARAILTEIEDGRTGRHGGVYLDFSSVDPEDVETFLPHTLTRILEAGF
ncbi:MAG: FAD-dependent oxidoreductase, partial [Candidatus Bathyarchaeia archaeon]